MKPKSPTDKATFSLPFPIRQFAALLLLTLFTCRPLLAAEFNTALLPTVSAAEMQTAIQNGLNVNQTLPDGSTLFMLAAAQSTLPVIEIFLQNGANVNASDFLGNTVLMNAAQFNSDDKVTALLLARGAAVNAVNKAGGSALIYAANQNPNPLVVAELLKAGADANQIDNGGVSPLIAAATTSLDLKQRDTPEVIRLLTAAGADPHYYYHQARPLDYALANPHLRYSAAVQHLKDAMWNWQQ